MAYSATTPPLDEIVLDPEEIENAAHGVVDDLANRLRAVIQGRDGRHHHSPDLDGLHYKTRMSEVQRRLTRKQNQPTTFLERHVGCPK